MFILGISSFYHDSAACLIRDGEILAATQEERFTRKKHDERFPRSAISYCLKHGGISERDLSYIAFYEKPIIKFDRILQTAIAYAPAGFFNFIQAMPLWLKSRFWIREIIVRELPNFHGKIIFPTHHESHAASAFYPSPFEKAAILTLDAVGEWNTATYGIGEKNKITLKKAINFQSTFPIRSACFTPHSLITADSK